METNIKPFLQTLYSLVGQDDNTWTMSRIIYSPSALYCTFLLSGALISTAAFGVVPNEIAIQQRQVFGHHQRVHAAVTTNTDTSFPFGLPKRRSGKLTAFTRYAKGEDSDDIPEDWSEDDILAEFEDLEEGETSNTDDDSEEDDEDDDDVVMFEESLDDDDDDDDDVDLDEIDLDEDDDDDSEDIIATEWEEEEESVPYNVNNDLEWDEDEDGGDYELENDPDDSNYMKQKELIEATLQSSEKRMADESFDALDFIMNDMTEDQSEIMDKLPFMKDIEARARSFALEESDVEDIDMESAVAEASDFTREEYEPHGKGEVNFLEKNAGITDEEMKAFDDTYRQLRDTIDEEPWDKVMTKELKGWDNIDNKTMDEMDAALEELGGSSYNVTRWLLYDLDFNVSNLLLASIQHNPEAPILFNHWYPQLVTYSRYSDVRAKNFDFSWEDVEKADMKELERYYAGFGYDEIPSKAPAETGIISFEDLDEEEIKMAAFENWMAEVYNPEWDRKDFDDDDMQDEDNVFSAFFEAPQHPDLPSFEDAEEDIENWKEDVGDDPKVVDYRNDMGQTFKYDVVNDEEFQRDFRGHVVIACTGDDEDLEIAEKITLRFEKEFGKQVWVETRVEALAREEDSVFEIWLESYEIDLLHSKKRANSSNQDWKGPAECDDAQIDYLVDRVRFLTSDDARYSYRVEYELAD